MTSFIHQKLLGKLVKATSWNEIFSLLLNKNGEEEMDIGSFAKMCAEELWIVRKGLLRKNCRRKIVLKRKSPLSEKAENKVMDITLLQLK